MNKLTFDQFTEIAITQASKFQRRGQAMLNKLDDISNEIYSSVIDFGPDGVDPFYVDEKIPAFLKYLLANHVELPATNASMKQEGLRPNTIKVGQFYKSSHRDIASRQPSIFFFGATTRDSNKHLVIIAPEAPENGKVVVDPSRADEGYWDCFYEVPAPTLES